MYAASNASSKQIPEAAKHTDLVLLSRQQRADSYVLKLVGTLLKIEVCNILGCTWPKRPVNVTLTA
jgi:hypothetical protein